MKLFIWHMKNQSVVVHAPNAMAAFWEANKKFDFLSIEPEKYLEVDAEFAMVTSRVDTQELELGEINQ